MEKEAKYKLVNIASGEILRKGTYNYCMKGMDKLGFAGHFSHAILVDGDPLIPKH